MRFRVSRTSFAGDKAPCPAAVKVDGEDVGDWFIEIETLDDLVAFAAAQGLVIVSADNGDPRLEIYDYYRE